MKRHFMWQIYISTKPSLTARYLTRKRVRCVYQMQCGRLSEEKNTGTRRNKRAYPECDNSNAKILCFISFFSFFFFILGLVTDNQALYFLIIHSEASVFGSFSFPFLEGIYTSKRRKKKKIYFQNTSL